MATIYEPATDVEVAAVLADLAAGNNITTGFAYNPRWDPPVRRAVGVGGEDPADPAIAGLVRSVFVEEMAANAASLVQSKVNDLRVVTVQPGRNLYDPADPDIVTGVVLNSTGATPVSALYRVSGWIPVKAGLAYAFSSQDAAGVAKGPRNILFYDTAKAAHTFVDNSGQAPLIRTPTFDGFVRVSIANANANNILVEQSAAIGAYEPFTLTAPKLTLTGSQISGSLTAPLRVRKSGEDYYVATRLGSLGVLETRTSRSGTPNGTFNILGSTLEGVAFHTTTDDATPIRTFNTVGANHGYTCMFTFTVAGHGKTQADLGSIYTDGARPYTLLKITGNDLTFGGDYTVTNGITTGSSVAPAASLTHVSGGTNTAAVSISTLQAVGNGLFPSVNQISVRYLLDGVEITQDGTYTGSVLRVIESYTVMDYKHLIDWARANVGQSYATVPIEGVVRVNNVFTYRSGGRCTVSSTLTALKKVSFSTCGFLQSAIMTRTGYTLKRYMPGVVPKSGYDFSSPVDMTAYNTSITFTPAGLADPTTPPTYVVDWLHDAGGNKYVGFAIGYVPDKTNSKNSDRVAQASVWDMRNTKKLYPVAIASLTLNPGDSRNFEGFRNFLAPHPSGATVVNRVTDDAATYVQIAFHTAQTATPIPLPEEVGRTVQVLQATGLTVSNDTVDASGLTVNVAGASGRAIVKLT